MSTTSTPNIGLVKPTPGTGEYADVSVINGNMDKIDAAVGDVDVQTDGSLQSQIDGVRESVDKLEASVSNVHTLIGITTASTTKTSYSTILSRKLSDYDMLLFIFLDFTSNSDKSIRDSVYVDRAVFESYGVISRNVLYGASSSSPGNFTLAGIAYEYDSDTSIKVNLFGSAAIKRFMVCGVKKVVS